MCLENVPTTNMSQIGLNHLSHIGIRKVDEQSLKQSRWELDLEEHLVSREVSLVISCRTLKLKIFLTQVPCWLLLLFINTLKLSHMVSFHPEGTLWPFAHEYCSGEGQGKRVPWGYSAVMTIIPRTGDGTSMGEQMFPLPELESLALSRRLWRTG